MINTKYFKGIATFAAMVCVTTTLSAEDPEIPPMQKPDPRAASKAKLIEHYDEDRNGKLDKDEIEKIGRDRLLENDRNKDGRVDQVELNRPRAGVRKMPRMDALQRAMAREEALSAAKAQLEKKLLNIVKKPAKDQGK